MLFKQILVALDLTEMDDFLLRYALFLVKKFKTEKWGAQKGRQIGKKG